MSLYFLDLEQVLRIHRDQIERYGGEASIRDLGLLESAIAMPQAGFGGQFLHNDVFEMAAAYLFHIAKNHPFVDGNKRTGLASALVFLELNAVDVVVDEDRLADMVLEVAEGKLGKEEIAAFFRKHAKERKKAPRK
jgi:death-on-curing protein